MVLYDYDSNAILSHPLNICTGPELLKAFQILHAQLVKRSGIRPRLHQLDNEASKALKEFLVDQDMDFQLASPHLHRHNAAEQAIRAFKNHLNAGLATTNPLFPLHPWDHLLPQAQLTLKLLHPFCINPKLSAYAQLFRAFNYNHTPLDPPGTKVVIHDKPSKRKSWATHGTPGWYLGPALENYRCYRVWDSRTNVVHIADTVEFFPHKSPMSRLSSADAAMHAAQDLTQALLNPHPAAPFLDYGTN